MNENIEPVEGWYDSQAVTLEDQYANRPEKETYLCVNKNNPMGLCRGNSHSRYCEDFNGGEYDKYLTREYLNSQEVFQRMNYDDKEMVYIPLPSVFEILTGAVEETLAVAKESV